jgi:hypothetical protein
MGQVQLVQLQNHVDVEFRADEELDGYGEEACPELLFGRSHALLNPRYGTYAQGGLLWQKHDLRYV